MSEASAIVASIVINVITMLNAAVFAQIIFNSKFNIKLVALYSGITGLIGSGVAIFLADYNPNIKMILMFGIMVLFLKLIFKLNYSKSIIATGLFLILQAFGNAVASICLSALGFRNIFDGNLKVYIIANIIINLVTITAFVIIRSFKLFSQLPKEVKTKAYVSNVVYILFTIVVISVNMTYCYQSYGNIKNIEYIVFTAVLMLGFLIYSIVNTNTHFKLETKSQELQYQIFYNKTLDTIMSDLSRFKHNYSNALNVLYAYTKMKKWDELTKYIGELVGETNRVNEANSIIMLNIKNAGILGLITAKTDYAAKQNVNIKINVADEVKEINMKISELYEVLGILLDNAIEAAAASTGRYVGLYITNKDGIVTFSIENSVDQKVKISEIFNKGYSTKGSGRGMGLWYIDKIMRKYDNVILNTFSEDKAFRQELVIS
ncbi:MAG: GHKL domain-containing protein [Clostridia bacterium]|nr:GHKL domain-containing protein [Clostridia bacterium]